MECLNPSIYPNKHYSPCGYKPLKNRLSISMFIPSDSTNITLNISELPLESLDSEMINYFMYGKRYEDYQKHR